MATWASEPAKAKNFSLPLPGALFRVTPSQALVRLVGSEVFERSHLVFVTLRSDTVKPHPDSRLSERSSFMCFCGKVRVRTDDILGDFADGEANGNRSFRIIVERVSDRGGL